MLARTPRTAAFLAQKPAPRRQLAKPKRDALVDRVVDILRDFDVSPFEHEAACRHGLRSALCLAGWTWARADLDAADVVARALARTGAKRPTWAEGQPEYTQDGVARVELTRCMRCGKPLPEQDGQHYRKWCSRVCASSAHHDRNKQDRLAYARAYARARIAAKPPQTCLQCGDSFKPKTQKPQHYCSVRCAHAGRGRQRRE